MTFNPGNLSKTASSANLASWRATLATGVASAALFAYGGRPVRAAPPAGCAADISGTIVTCSGDQSSGISLLNGGGTYTTLNVSALTNNIAPATGVYGINFTSNGPVELNLDAGAFNIVTTGDGAVGVFAASGTPGGGSVTINSTANIATSGNFADGIAGSSIYGNVTIVSTGDINTAGNQSNGISSATNSGDIHITSLGAISTGGSNAYGISAVSTSGDIEIDSRGVVTTQGVAARGIYARSGGDISVDLGGIVTTHGNYAAGVYARSNAGDVRIKSTGDIETSGDFGLGIYARAAQTTRVYSYGNIVTRGDDAPAIAAEGANGVAVVSQGTIRTYGTVSPGITAYGNLDVGVVSTSNITTTGPGSDGINVLSVNGMAVVVSSGDISATGTGSAGIYAAGYTGTVVMNRGNIVGGPCCAGVMQSSAGNNQLLNWGTITAGLSDFAIDNVGGSNAVVNFGTVTGDVRLFDTGGSSSFINQAGALFNTGANVDAGHVVNDGTLAPGGRGVVLTTALGDALTQNAGGTLAIDINGATADRINVSDGAVLAGKVAINFVSLPTSAVQSFTILTAASGVTNTGLGLSANPVLHATLSFSNPNTVQLGIAIDFATSGLDRNGMVVAENLNSVFAAGGGGVAPALLGLLNATGAEDYKAAIDELQPKIYQDSQIAALYANLAFSNALLSCRVNGSDTASVIREGQCLWAGATARFLDSDSTSQQPGFKETAGLFAAGAQIALNDVWRLGFAAGYQSSSLTTTNGASSDGEQAQAGVALKYNSGPLLLAAALTGGRAWNDTTRSLTFGGFDAVAEGDQRIDLFSGALRAAYVFGAPSLYFKPMVDVSATRLDYGDMQESGGGGVALSVQGSGHTVFAVTPALEVGTEWWLSNGTLVRPFVRAGATWYDGVDMALSASFAGAPDGVGPFTIHTDMDDVMGVVGAGLDLINGEDGALRFTYDGQLGETTQIHSIGIKGSAKF